MIQAPLSDHCGVAGAELRSNHIMEVIADGCLLLDATALVAQAYQHHTPVTAAGPQAPYQGSGAASSSGAGGGSDTQQLSSSGQEPQVEPDAAAGEQLPAAAEPGHCKRRRRKSGGRPPNTAELAAQERADAALPLLQGALDALRQWMRAREHTSLAADELQSGGSGKQPPRQQQVEPAAAPSGGGAAHEAATGWTAEAERAVATVPPSDSEAAAAGPPDYVALAALRHVLRPKFEWSAGPGGGPTALPDGGSASGQCNLFGQLVRNDSAEEAVGLAAGHEVVIPAGSAFLMSDVKQLAPLLEQGGRAGMRGCTGVCVPFLFAVLLHCRAQAGFCRPGSASAGEAVLHDKSRHPSSPLPRQPSSLHILSPPPDCKPPHPAMHPTRSPAARELSGFQCIVLDPPWENASTARGAKYPTLPSRNLLALPLPALMRSDNDGGSGVVGPAASAPGCGGSGGASSSSEGCLVALWVTNRERHRRFVERELLPAWGLQQVATWYWLKVAANGEPVGRLVSSRKQQGWWSVGVALA